MITLDLVAEINSKNGLIIVINNKSRSIQFLLDI